MTNADAEGKRSESPGPDTESLGDETGAGAPAGGVAVPPQRASDRAGEGGVDEAALGGGSGDLGGGDVGGDRGGLDDESNRP